MFSFSVEPGCVADHSSTCNVRFQWHFVEETIQKSKRIWKDHQSKLCWKRSGADPRRKVRFSKQCSESVRNRAPLPPERTPLQQTATWFGPPSVPPLEVDEMDGSKDTPTAHHIFSCTVVAQLFRSLVVKIQEHIDLHALAWLKIEAHLCVAPQNTSCSSRHVLHLADFDTTHGHSFLTFSRTNFPTFCQDPRPLQRGALTEPTLPTSYEPNRIVEDRDYKHFTGDGQFTELEDLRVRHLSFYQSIMASTCDSAERIATAPESDFDDEQLRALASPKYLQERIANAERSQVYLSVRENLMSSSSQDLVSTERPSAWLFSSKNWLNPETFSEREDFSRRHQQVLGNNEPLFRLSNPANVATSFLDGNRDHLLAKGI